MKSPVCPYLALVSLLLLPAAPAAATVIVSLSPSTASTAVGGTLDLELRADLTQDTVVGFGLDLVFDDSVLALVGVMIGPGWDAAFAPDGDGLAAFAPLAGAPAGADVLLATVTLFGVAPGKSTVSVTATPGDLTEGFPLASPPGSFAELASSSATIVVPEPGAAPLVLLAFVALPVS